MSEGVSRCPDFSIRSPLPHVTLKSWSPCRPWRKGRTDFICARTLYRSCCRSECVIDADIIVNVQGDEPLVRPEMLELVVKPLLPIRILLCANLMSEIVTERDMNDRNVIKTVFDKSLNALYFSRSAIPSLGRRPNTRVLSHKQLGIIAFVKNSSSASLHFHQRHSKSQSRSTCCAQLNTDSRFEWCSGHTSPSVSTFQVN